MSNNIDIKIKAKTEGIAEIQKLEKELSTLGNIDAFKKLKKDLQESKSAWEAAQVVVAALAKELHAADKPTKALSDQFKAAKDKAAKLKAEFQANQEALHKLRGTLGDAGVNTSKLSSEQARLEKALAQTRQEANHAAKEIAAGKKLEIRSFSEVQKEIEATKAAYRTLKDSGKLSAAELYKAQANMKSQIAALKDETNGWANSIASARAGLATFAAAGYAAVQSFQGYSEFSQRMAEVNTLLDISEDKFKSLSQEVINLSTEIPQTASELAAAQYDIISAGVDLESSIKTLELSSKAAVAGVTDTQTAVNIGVGVINAYGKSIDELEGVYDVLFQTVKTGVTTFPELSQHLGDVLPSARAAGVGIDEVGAAIAAMTKAGIKTPAAATALKGAINAMASPAPEAKEVFEALGITWEGLLPTLDAISKKSLSMDQMRKLIPDVEARTGVFALTQNMDGLKDIMGEVVGASGSTQEAFDKMKDTPENQIKLFKNEISALAIEFGGLVSEALLPVLKGLIDLKNQFEQLDPVTQGLVTVLAGAGPAFLVWELGLSKIVLGLKGASLQALASIKDLLAFEAQSMAAGLAIKAAFAGAVIYTGYQLVELTKAVWGYLDALEDADKAQAALVKSCDKIMEKFKEFKDVKLPDDIMGTSPEQLESFRMDLQKAKAYFVALQTALQVKSEETNWLGQATDEAKAASEELKKVDARLAEVNGDLRKLKESGIEAGKGMQEPAKAVKATTEQLNDFEKQAKEAYASATKKAEEYGKEVLKWEDKIQQARMSTADKLRELGRTTMDEEEVWNDKRLQAEEKLSEAKKALKEGDYELAEQLAKDAEGLYAGLAVKVENTENGETVVVKSIEATQKVAMNGIQAVGDFQQELYGKQKTSAEESQKEWETTAAAIKTKLDEISTARKALIEIELKNLTDAQSKINALVKDEIKHITIKVKKESSTSDSGSDGVAGYARGGNLPGYGGGDVIPAMLEPGEWVIRKEAVKKYGNTFLARLNAGLLGFKTGGLIPSLAVAKGYNSGGPVSKDAYPEDIQSLIKKFYEFLNDNVKSMSSVTKNVSSFWRYRTLKSYDYKDWPTEGSENPDMGEVASLISAYQRAMTKTTGGSSRISDKLEAYIEELMNAGLNIGTPDAWPKFQLGGLVDSISKPNFSIPNIPSIPNISGIGGVGGGASRTVNHSVTLNINGNTVGPLSGDQATIGDFISQLKKAQRVT